MNWPRERSRSLKTVRQSLIREILHHQTRCNIENKENQLTNSHDVFIGSIAYFYPQSCGMTFGVSDKRRIEKKIYTYFNLLFSISTRKSKRQKQRNILNTATPYSVAVTENVHSFDSITTSSDQVGPHIQMIRCRVRHHASFDCFKNFPN